MSNLKILVGCKRVIDYAVKVRVNSSKAAVETANIKHSLNPFDEIAVEEAVKIRERLGGKVSEIIALTCGPPKSQEQLRTALAMGADKAIHVKVGNDDTINTKLEPLSVAKLFKAIVEKEKPNLIILGKQAIDDDSNQTGQIKLPAVITTDLRLNEPRFATLPNIMKAKKKQLIQFTLEQLNVDISPRLETISVADPPVRQGGTKVGSVDDLISKLKESGIL
ncbi:9395_t:CDS:2 [Entrophospora sp. SA101]|nr:13974_t:CDS:2 [Entrophospora sp. SA101]CAJ0765328.1 9395_t:CDS:2 [Entrophospora sp. SA101]CAJ0839305.1 14531_t:CDS:2 [Entrophospora sp. SA101]CAJ0839321.1 14537_t:CDS:2 [Entrophospora sp. SA101]CAJ0901647.1 450_t:CDS:2 [Entrophospora sp. SA101]